MASSRIGSGRAPQGDNSRRREYVESKLDPKIRLTRHAVDILDCLARGLKVPAIAKEFGIAPDTVYEEIDVMKKKLGARSRDELMRLAIRHGFIDA